MNPARIHAIEGSMLSHPQGVKKIKVNMIGLKFGQLFIQKGIKILRFFNFPNRAFGGQIHSFPVAALQSLAGNDFTLPIQIVVGGIHIV